MQEHVEAFVAMLAHPVSKDAPNPNSIRRCLYALEDSVKADFDNQEFKAHFIKPNAVYDDD